MDYPVKRNEINILKIIIITFDVVKKKKWEKEKGRGRESNACIKQGYGMI